MPNRRMCGALLLLAAGCAGETEGPAPSGRPAAGDALRPRLHLPEPWTAGTSTAFGCYVEVTRPGRPDPFDLRDDVVVPTGSVRVVGTLSFFAGDAPLGDATALAFVHEC